MDRVDDRERTASRYTEDMRPLFPCKVGGASCSCHEKKDGVVFALKSLRTFESVEHTSHAIVQYIIFVSLEEAHPVRLAFVAYLPSHRPLRLRTWAGVHVTRVERHW